MRVLVTGGSGYIGMSLMAALARRDEVAEVVDVDLRPPAATVPKVRYVERSVTEDLRDLFAEPDARVDVAMHLAWALDPMHDAQRQREICVGGTQNFLEGCVAGDVRHVLFVSSATAYGAHPAHAVPVSEDEPLKAFHHFQYSAEKREAEELFRRFAADRPGTLLQIARPVLVAGPNVSNFVFRGMDKPVAFRPIGTDLTFQLIHQDDVAEALVAIVMSKQPGAFNLAGDETIRLSEVYRYVGACVVPLPMSAILAIVGVAWRRKWTKITEAPPEFVYFVTYPWLLSNRRIKDEVGFTFRYTLRETLDSVLAARRSRGRMRSSTEPATAGHTRR